MASQERRRESASPNLPPLYTTSSHWLPTSASPSSISNGLLLASVFSFNTGLTGPPIPWANSMRTACY
ncbi:hypothetical protein DM01DRAFT_1332604 [Hesseltinella vesiculosa]|uniref:Uncharacterized protein n=1 Tax=Hesseltinella vesiculosa TaxID=101127 RepID=A0A1X2GSR6_9FUNG|nr:hypothetical protein DM01DRAFT_1332604 [Hesseltinella vesiculosa]